MKIHDEINGERRESRLDDRMNIAYWGGRTQLLLEGGKPFA